MQWTPVRGEVLVLRREPHNIHDPYAVAIMKSEKVVGHVPKAYSRIVSCFIGHGNRASCEITGDRINRGVQLGVEVPCVYKFYGSQAYIDRIRDLLQSL